MIIIMKMITMLKRADHDNDNDNHDHDDDDDNDEAACLEWWGVLDQQNPESDFPPPPVDELHQPNSQIQNYRNTLVHKYANTWIHK